MKDDLCAGCLNPVLHKYCPAHGSPLYCLSLFAGPKIVYSDKIHKARKLSEFIHRNQKRWNGENYFASHINAVVTNCLDYVGICENPENLICLAYLHDCIEDVEEKDRDVLESSMESDFQHLSGQLEVLTKKDLYHNYILKIVSSGHRDAMLVKLSDLRHNMSSGLDIKSNQYTKYVLSEYILMKELGIR